MARIFPWQPRNLHFGIRKAVMGLGFLLVNSSASLQFFALWITFSEKSSDCTLRKGFFSRLPCECCACLSLLSQLEDSGKQSKEPVFNILLGNSCLTQVDIEMSNGSTWNWIEALKFHALTWAATRSYSKVNEQLSLPGTLLKCNFWFHRSPVSLPFWQVPDSAATAGPWATF